MRGGGINIVPQTSILNRGDGMEMKNDFRTALNEGKSVSVRIEAGHPSGARPNEFFVTAMIDGEKIVPT